MIDPVIRAYMLGRIRSEGVHVRLVRPASFVGAVGNAIRVVASVDPGIRFPIPKRSEHRHRSRQIADLASKIAPILVPGGLVAGTLHKVTRHQQQIGMLFRDCLNVVAHRLIFGQWVARDCVTAVAVTAEGGKPLRTLLGPIQGTGGERARRRPWARTMDGGSARWPGFRVCKRDETSARPYIVICCPRLRWWRGGKRVAVLHTIEHNAVLIPRCRLKVAEAHRILEIVV